MASSIPDPGCVVWPARYNPFTGVLKQGLSVRIEPSIPSTDPSGIIRYFSKVLGVPASITVICSFKPGMTFSAFLRILSLSSSFFLWYSSVPLSLFPVFSSLFQGALFPGVKFYALSEHGIFQSNLFSQKKKPKAGPQKKSL